jgi:uncharacterized membrane protein (DUF373 family)
MPHTEPPLPETRKWMTRAFTIVEDVVYVGLSILLAVSAGVLLVMGSIEFVQSIGGGKPATVELLDRLLLVLLIVELLYTVQVSFRKHTISPEPFLLIGLISAIRRVLLVTAEFGEQRDKSDAATRHFVLELCVLTGLILVITISLVLLRRLAGPVVAERS